MTTIQFHQTPFTQMTRTPIAAPPRLRMTVRGRRVLTALVVVPLVIVVAAFALNGGGATATNDTVPLSYVSVQQGETMWQLAEQVAPSADPRDVIADILTLNALDSSQVVAGQRLAIPQKYADR